MKEKEKQFYNKILELEAELMRQRVFMQTHKFDVEKLAIGRTLDYINSIKIQYSLFFDGTFTIDQVDLTR